MDVVVTAVGVALIALALRDIFETLFHPTGRGILARGVARTTAVLAARLPKGRSGLDALAGPLGYLFVLATWTTMLVVGWALVFLPHLPEGFGFEGSLVPAEHDSFVDAIYISLVNLTSLGYGDVTPVDAGLRILGPIETLFGLGLLTASISWLISIHVALSRRDAFAHEVLLNRQAEERLGEKLADADPALLERILASFTEQLIAVRRDLIHFPITHLFRSEDERIALSNLHPFLARLIHEASEEGRPHALKVRAEMLRTALEDFDATLRDRLDMEGFETPEPERPGGA